MSYNTDGYGFPPENNGYNNMNPVNGSFGSNQYRHPEFIPVPVWLKEKKYIKKLSILAGGSILLYVLLSAVYVGILQGVGSYLSSANPAAAENMYNVIESAEFQYLFSVLYSIFMVGGPFFLLGYIFRKKGLIGNIPMEKPHKAKYLPLVIIGGFGLCLVGNVITSYLDILIEMLTGFELSNLEMPSTPRNAGGVLLFFLSTAVVPALVEEMALRGVVMQPLRRYGDWYAIICSAVIFGLMHCNLVQIPFAFIAGIVIGYAVVVTESVWTGVIIHFMNNAFSVLVSVVDDFYGMDSWQYKVCDIVFYIMIAVGCLCAFIVWKKYSDKPMKKSPLVNCGKGFLYQPPLFSAKISNKKLYGAYAFTAPMIAAFIMVCYETVIVLIYT